jgi:hypothetical protein
MHLPPQVLFGLAHVGVETHVLPVPSLVPDGHLHDFWSLLGTFWPGQAVHTSPAAMILVLGHVALQVPSSLYFLFEGHWQDF